MIARFVFDVGPSVYLGEGDIEQDDSRHECPGQLDAVWRQEDRIFGGVADGVFAVTGAAKYPHEHHEDSFGQEEEEGRDVEDDVEEKIDVPGVSGDAFRHPPTHEWGNGEAD